MRGFSRNRNNINNCIDTIPKREKRTLRSNILASSRLSIHSDIGAGEKREKKEKKEVIMERGKITFCVTQTIFFSRTNGLIFNIHSSDEKKKKNK